MKNSSKILNLLSAFMAIIGLCAATLVCFIVIYSQINGRFSPNAHNTPEQTYTITQANYGVDNITTEINTLTETNLGEDDSTISLDDSNSTYNIIDNPEPENIQSDFDTAFPDNEEYFSTETQNPNYSIKNTEPDNSSDAILFTIPVEQETSNASFVTGSSNANNFNTYNNVDQQNTVDAYVLNTESKKIHYSTCRDVPKIAQQNYSTSNLSLNELINQGYTTCGHCF